LCGAEGKEIPIPRAIELVEDRATKRPFDPKHPLHARVKKEALAAGLLCYPMGGTLDGKRGDHVLLAPPFIAGEAQFEELTHAARRCAILRDRRHRRGRSGLNIHRGGSSS